VDETRLYLSVGEFGSDPSAVTAFLGLTPTFAAAAGEPLPGRPTMRRKYGRWEYGSPLPVTEPVAAHLNALLPMLEERAELIRMLHSKYAALLQCVIYVREGCNPGFDLPGELLGRVAALGLSLDFDIYCLGGEGPTPSDVPAG